jgi:hypothetical protein
MKYSPFFGDQYNLLVLPSHIPKEYRTVILPAFPPISQKKTKKAMLCLLALARLMNLGVLNDRFKPLKSKEDFKVFIDKVLPPINQFQNVIPELLAPLNDGIEFDGYITHLRMNGVEYDKQRRMLVGPGLHLGLVTTIPLQNIPPLTFHHKEFGVVTLTYEKSARITLSSHQRKMAEKFHSRLFTLRWAKKKFEKEYVMETASSRKTRLDEKTKFFESLLIEDETEENHSSFEEAVSCSTMIWSIVVPLLSFNPQPQIDWNLIKEISEKEVNFKTRQFATTNFTATQIWHPIYSPNTLYVVSSQSIIRPSDPFPSEGYASFSDYFLSKYSQKVVNDTPMFNARILWEAPSSMSEIRPGTDNNSPTDHKKIKFLPHSLFFLNPVIPYASLYFSSIFLPQTIYYLQHVHHTQRFISHVHQTLPSLYPFLQQANIWEVMEILTASSCEVPGFS